MTIKTISGVLKNGWLYKRQHWHTRNNLSHSSLNDLYKLQTFTSFQIRTKIIYRLSILDTYHIIHAELGTLMKAGWGRALVDSKVEPPISNTHRKTNTMYHMHTLGASKCMHVVHSVGFALGVGDGWFYLKWLQQPLNRPWFHSLKLWIYCSFWVTAAFQDHVKCGIRMSNIEALG